MTRKTITTTVFVLATTVFVITAAAQAGKFKSPELQQARKAYTTEAVQAEKTYRRELAKIKKQHAKALVAAKKKFTTKLEAGKLAAMQANDLAEAGKIDNTIKALNPQAADPTAKKKTDAKAEATAMEYTGRSISQISNKDRWSLIKKSDKYKKKYLSAKDKKSRKMYQWSLFASYDNIVRPLWRIHHKFKKYENIRVKYAPAVKKFSLKIAAHGETFMGEDWLEPTGDPEKLIEALGKLQKKISETPAPPKK